MHAGIPVLQQPVAGGISVHDYCRNGDFLICSVIVCSFYILNLFNVVCHILALVRAVIEQAVGGHLSCSRRSCPSGIHRGIRAVSQRIVAYHVNLIFRVVCQVL